MPLAAYSARILPLGEIYLLVSERKTLEGSRVAEMFLLIPNAATPYRSGALRFAWGAARPDATAVAHIDLDEMACQWAYGFIEEELLAASDPARPVVPLTKLEPADPQRLLAQLHVRRVMADQLRLISAESQSEELRNALSHTRSLPRLHIGAVDAF